MEEKTLFGDGAAQTPVSAQAAATQPATENNTQPAAPAAEKEDAPAAAANEKPAAVKEPAAKPAKAKEEKAEEKKEKLPTDIFHQLKYLQQQLKVGKGNINRQMNSVTMRDDSFPYRTLEDIYAELKPLLDKLDCTLTAPWSPVLVGGAVFATATVTLENAKGEKRETTASAMMNQKCESYKFPAQEALACGTMAIKAAIGSMFLLDNTTKERQDAMITPGMEGMTQPGHSPLPAPQMRAQAPAAPAAQAPVQKAAQKAPVKAPEAVKPEVQTAAPAPAAQKPEEKPAAQTASPAPAAQAPAQAAAPSKPVLVKGSTTFNNLGIAARSFPGTAERLRQQIAGRYTVDEDTLEAFVQQYYRGSAT